MKNSIFKKTLSVLLVMCISLSATAISISAEAPPASIWKTGAKSFGVNKVYSTGLVAVGTVLTRVAQASECEEFEKLASFINVWVCGGNPTTQTLAEITELCNQILTEVRVIEEKMDSYASYFATQEAQNKYDILVEDMYDTWDDDVDNVIDNHGLSSAMRDFFEYEDITPPSENDTNRTIGYFAAAYHRANNTSDKYGNTYDDNKVNAKREQLFNDFCKMYGAMPSDADTSEKKAEYLFSTSVVDDAMQSAIRELAYNINKSNSYADSCAQVAYQSLPNLCDQYEYVANGINKQFMQICIVEMLYQEYLAMRGEYLEYKYPNDEARWNVYRSNISELANCNEELLGYMESRISKPLHLDTYITLALDEYVTVEDSTGTILKNTAYKSKTDSDDNPKSFNGYETSAAFTKEYMSFNRISVPTSSGKVDTYYVLDVDTDGEGGSDTTGISADNAKIKKMVHKFDRNALDLYYSSCDSYNLRFCTYTDGVNNYICPATPSDEQSLFATNSFDLYGSTPYAYLSRHFGYIGDKRLYQMFSKSKIDYTADGWFTDDHMIYDTLDMMDSYVGFDTSLNLVEKVNAKVVYEKDYTKSGYDKGTYDSYYTIILKEQSDTPKNTLSYAVTGAGNADVYITDSNGVRIQSGSSVECGTDLTLWMKSTSDNIALNTLTRYKYNDLSATTIPTSTENLLTRDNFYSLPADENTGYFKLDFTMPYSNTKLELNTAAGYSVSYENAVDDTPVNFYAYNNVFVEGEAVEFIYNGKIDHAYICTQAGVNPIKMEYSNHLNNSYGSFAMPKGGATILIASSSFTDTDSPLLSKSGDTYVIPDYEALLCMSVLVNSGNTEYTKASYILTNDIDLSNKHLPTIKSFGGTFDGDGHSADNLNVGTSAEDGNHHPLFSTIESGAVVKNLVMRKAQIFTAESPVTGSGVIAKRNYGTIENCLVTSSDIQLGNWEYLGGIAGYNKGVIKNCGIADSSLTRHCCDSSTKTMGGITEVNDGSVENCFVYNCTFTNGTADNGVLIAKGNAPVNSYFFTESSNTSKAHGTEKPQTAFAIGEVAYLLNSGVTDGTQAWYQNLHTDKADAYPVPFSTHRTVYKLSDSVYANTASINTTLPPIIGGTNTTPGNTDAVSSSNNTVNKGVVATGMSGCIILMSIAITAAVIVLLLHSKKKLYYTQAASK